MYRRIQKEDQYCLAAELQPVSGTLVVSTEFHTTTDGRRMAPYFE
jgi:hypothetical protein